jgi:hypothetical protein
MGDLDVAATAERTGAPGLSCGLLGRAGEVEQAV